MKKSTAWYSFLFVASAAMAVYGYTHDFAGFPIFIFCAVMSFRYALEEKAKS